MSLAEVVVTLLFDRHVYYNCNWNEVFTTPSLLVIFQWNICSPNGWTISLWFLPQEFDTAGTAQAAQVLSHRTLCFDSPKRPLRVALGAPEFGHASVSTLCKERAEVNLHPRSEPRFFQNSDTEHNFLDFCRPWLRSTFTSWQQEWVSYTRPRSSQRGEPRADSALWLMTSHRNCPKPFYRCTHQQVKIY